MLVGGAGGEGEEDGNPGADIGGEDIDSDVFAADGVDIGGGGGEEGEGDADDFDTGDGDGDTGEGAEWAGWVAVGLDDREILEAFS
ncbi:MAG: hypothetical protein RI897_1579 [Verrucomicrobiota bacterium]